MQGVLCLASRAELRGFKLGSVLYGILLHVPQREFFVYQSTQSRKHGKDVSRKTLFWNGVLALKDPS